MCAVTEFEIPPHLDAEISTLCINQLSCEKIIVGHENGIYITSIGATDSENIVKRLEGSEVPSAVTDESSNGNIFYAASENNIYKFDIRCPLNEEVHCFKENSDEVNFISMNEKGFLASCDDSGECKIFDTRKGTLYRTLRKRHKNICSSAAFLTTRPDDIVTGGLDSQLIVWNHATVRFIQDINTQDILQKLGDNSVNMFNPPMVNALCLSQDGKLLASGLGKIFMAIP